MSKTHPPSYIKFLLLIAALQIFTEARGQHVAVEISVDAAARKAAVKGRFEDGYKPETGRVLSFRRAVIGNERLAERIGEVSAFSGSGSQLDVTKLAAHQHVAAGDFGRFEYTVDLSPGEARAAAHSSWMAADGGVLMLDDLLPLFGGERKRQRVTLSLCLPEGWRSYSADRAGGKDFYDVRNLEGSVLFVGPRFREVTVKPRNGPFSLVLDGGWNFTDAEAAKAAGEIYDAYAKMLGGKLENPPVVALSKFPQGANPGTWEAETRGGTVLIVSSDVPFKDRSYQRMHEQLRHEIFHLWFPNAVNLTGDYAWFYEGSALYESLKLGVATRQVTFETFLDTLSRAYRLDSSIKARKPLIGAEPTEVYARGMLIAFLLDVRLASAKKGGLASALSDILAKHKSLGEPVAAADVIGSIGEARELIEKYVTGADIVDWSAELSMSGLIAEQRNGQITLTVMPNLSGSQKAILKSLGYN